MKTGFWSAKIGSVPGAFVTFRGYHTTRPTEGERVEYQEDGGCGVSNMSNLDVIVNEVLALIEPLDYFIGDRVLDEAMRRHDAKVCGECGEYRPDDDRVALGMKCGQCVYGGVPA